MSIGRADREILDAMLATGHPVSGLPDGYIVYDKDHPDGRIATRKTCKRKALRSANMTGPSAPPCHTDSRLGRPMSKCHPTNT
jgi:hypothetical protein